MTTFLAVIVAGLLILVGVALIAFDVFARVFNNIFNRMFRRRRASYGYGALILLVLLYVAVKSCSTHH